MFRFRLHPLFDMEGANGGTPVAAPDAVVTPPVTEPPSVAAGGSEPPVAGSAPAAGSAEAQPPVIPDVSQQESFAARLKEERTKIAGEYEPYKQQASRLEAVAKAAGYTVDEYIAALDENVKAHHAAAEAKRLGVDPETYKQFFAPVHDELAQTKQQLTTLQQAEVNRQVRADYERLKTQHSDFESIQDKVFDLAEKRMLPLEDAYKLVSFDEKINAAKLEGQNAAVAALAANAQTATGPVGGDAPSNTFDFTKLSPDERKAMYEKAKRGELKSLH